MKTFICSGIGFIGSAIAYLFGGWDASLTTLLICMICDYITGLLVAGVFHKSKKTETGNLESRAGWKGLCKKFVTLLIIIIANRLDMQMGTQYVKDAVCISFIVNEIISIVENAGLMGIPMPQAITKAIAVLHDKK
jgi:toxin secretion/phage lysis holin